MKDGGPAFMNWNPVAGAFMAIVIGSYIGILWRTHDERNLLDQFIVECEVVGTRTEQNIMFSDVVWIYDCNGDRYETSRSPE